jgi:hypothetical protein
MVGVSNVEVCKCGKLIYYTFSSEKMETVSIVIKMENEEETENSDTSLVPKLSCKEIIKHERQE